MSPQHLLSARAHADRHGLADVRMIRLDDPAARHARALELQDGRDQRDLVGHHQDDGVRAFRQVPGTRLAGGVHQVRRKDPEREVPADDHVVAEGGRFFSGAAVGRFTAWTTS